MLQSTHEVRKFDEEEVDDLSQYPDRIAATFNGKTLFMTGATGFVGKALLEKILHHSDVKKVYVLIKDKKGLSSQERLVAMFEGIFFDPLRKENGIEMFNRVQAINGDVSLPELGISQEDRLKLINEVEIVYHMAASVRFDEPMKNIILTNVRGTKLMLALAKDIKKLLMFCYVSTCFCVQSSTTLYDAPITAPYNAHEIIEICENLESHKLEPLTKHMLKSFCNTYPFSKALAESLINEQIGKLPVMVVRPSIIMPAWKYPIPGYTDSLYGPMTIWIAYAVGLLKVSNNPLDVIVNYVPLDMVISALMISSYNYLNDTADKSIFCNATNMHISMTTMQDQLEHLFKKIVSDNALWYPTFIYMGNYVLYYILFILLQLMPAFLLDNVLKLTGRQPMFVKIQQKLFRTERIIHYYANNEHDFQMTVYRRLRTHLNPREDVLYPLSYGEVDLLSYAIDMITKVKILILKEKMEDMPKALKNHKRLYYLHTTTKIVFYAWFAYFVWQTLIPMAAKFLYYIFDV